MRAEERWKGCPPLEGSAPSAQTALVGLGGVMVAGRGRADRREERAVASLETPACAGGVGGAGGAALRIPPRQRRPVRQRRVDEAAHLLAMETDASRSGAIRLAEVIDEVPRAGGVWAATSDEAVSRGSAHGDLRVCALKEERGGSEAFKRGCDHVGLAVGGDLCAEIVKDDI